MNVYELSFIKSSRPAILLCLLMISLALPLIAGPLYAAESDTVPSFQDLDLSDENLRYVKFLQNRGIIDGFPDGTFRPYQPLTRGEAAKILVAVTGAPLQVPEEPTYSDVPKEHWAYPYIETATRLGLLNGYPDGTFQPGRQLTRAETAVILYRLYGIDYMWSGDSPAVDLPQWAYEEVNCIIDAGLMGVDAEKHFQPDWPTIRVEFARAIALLYTIHEDWRLVPLKATLRPKAGVVQVQKYGQPPQKVLEPTVLEVGDLVITGTNAEAEISFEDGSGFLLQANSEMKIHKLVGSLFILPDGAEASSVEDLEVHFSKGTMFGALATRGLGPEELPQTAGAVHWFKFPLLALAGEGWEGVGYSANATLTARGKIAALDSDVDAFKELPPWKQLQLKKVRVKVNMPHGVAAVRGSFWTIKLEQIGTRVREIVSFLYGEGEVQSGEYTVALGAGEKTSIEEPSAPPTRPEPMTKEEQQEWLTMKTWIGERVQEIKEKLVAPPVAPPPTPPAPQVPQGQQPVSGQQTPPGTSSQPSEPPVPQLSPSALQLSRILQSLQELLDTLETLEREGGLPAAPAEDGDGDDDSDYGGGGSEGGDDAPEPEPIEEPIPRPDDPGSGDALEPVIEVDRIILSDHYLELRIGETKILSYTIEPGHASKQEVTWASSDPSVATVDENGLVKAVGVGKATITISVGNGKYDTCEVMVTGITVLWYASFIDNANGFWHGNELNFTVTGALSGPIDTGKLVYKTQEDQTGEGLLAGYTRTDDYYLQPPGTYYYYTHPEYTHVKIVLHEADADKIRKLKGYGNNEAGPEQLIALDGWYQDAVPWSTNVRTFKPYRFINDSSLWIVQHLYYQGDNELHGVFHKGHMPGRLYIELAESMAEQVELFGYPAEIQDINNHPPLNQMWKKTVPLAADEISIDGYNWSGPEDKYLIEKIDVEGILAPGQVLTAVVSTSGNNPDLSSVKYQWQKSQEKYGPFSEEMKYGFYMDIEGATGSTYVLTEEDTGMWIVKVMGAEDNSVVGTMFSEPVGPVESSNFIQSGRMNTKWEMGWDDDWRPI